MPYNHSSTHKIDSVIGNNGSPDGNLNHISNLIQDNVEVTLRCQTSLETNEFPIGKEIICDNLNHNSLDPIINNCEVNSNAIPRNNSFNSNYSADTSDRQWEWAYNMAKGLGRTSGNIHKLFPHTKYYILVRPNRMYFVNKISNIEHEMNLNNNDRIYDTLILEVYHHMIYGYPYGGTTSFLNYDIIIFTDNMCKGKYEYNNTNFKYVYHTVRRKRKKSYKEQRSKRDSSLHSTPQTTTGLHRRQQSVISTDEMEDMFCRFDINQLDDSYTLHSIVESKPDPPEMNFGPSMLLGSKISQKNLQKTIEQLSTHKNNWAKLIESMLLCIGSISDSKTLFGQCCAIGQFLHGFLPNEMSASELFVTYFLPNYDQTLDENGNLTDDSYTVQGWIGNIKQFKDIPFFKHCATAASLLVGASLIKPTNFTKKAFEHFSIAVKPKQESSKDFITCLLDTLDFFFERGYQCFIDRSLYPLFTFDTEHSQFHADRAFVIANIGEVKTGNFEILHKDKKPALTLGDFIETVHKCKRYCKSMMCNNNALSSTMAGYLAQLEKIEAEYALHIRSSGFRVAPFTIKIFGPSSVGKTSVCRHLLNCVLRFNGYDATDDKVVSIDGDDKFQPNVRNNTTGIVFDDFANGTSAFTQMNPTSNLIKIINNNPCYANMPEAEMKGKVLMNPKVVALTTNLEDLNATAYSNEPYSVLRRCHVHIEVKLRPEMKNALGGMDYDAVDKYIANRVEQGTIEDIWLISVKELKEEPNTIAGQPSGYNMKSYKVFDDDGVSVQLKDQSIDVIMKYVLLESRKHFERQGALVKRQADLTNKTLYCATCTAPIGANGCCVICKGRNYLLSDDMKPHCAMDNMVPQSIVESLGTAIGMRAFEHNAATFLFNGVQGFMIDLKDVFSFNYLDKYIGRCMAKKLNKENLDWQCYDPYYGSPVLRLASHIIPHSMKQTKQYRALVAFLARKRIYRNVAQGSFGYAIVAVGSYGWTRVLKPKYRLLSGVGIFMLASLGWTEIWATSVKASFEKSFKKDLDFTAQLRLADEKALIENGRPTLSMVVRMTVFAGVGLIAARLIISSLSNIYNMYYDLTEGEELKVKGEVQGNIATVMQKDVEVRDAEVNIWKAIGTKFEPDCSTPDQFLNKISGNCLMMRVFLPNNQVKRTGAVMLRKGILMYPRHQWFDVVTNEETRTKDTLRFSLTRTNTNKAGHCWEEEIHWSETYVLPSSDICVSRISRGGEFLDITNLFADDISHAPLVRCQYRDGEGAIKRFSGSTGPPSYIQMTKFYPSVKGMFYFIRCKDSNWVEGACAALSVNDGPKPRIMGFHLVGNGENGFSAHLDTKMIKNAIEKLSEMLNLSRSLPHSIAEYPDGYFNIEYPVSEMISAKSPFANYQVGVGLYGTTNCVSYKTEYRLSKIADYCVENLGPCKWTTPCFKKVGDFDPWVEGCEAVLTASYRGNPHHIQLAINDFVEDLDFNDQDLSYVKPLTNHEILNGIDGKRFIDAINFNSACGIPLKGKKINYVVEIKSDTHMRCMDFAQEYQYFWTHLSELESLYEKGQLKGFIFKASLKDEIVSKQKARIFFCAPLLMQLHMRKYITPLLRLISMNPLMMECAVGMNPFSLEWHQLHMYLIRFGEDRVIAGDYKKWDLSMSVRLIEAGKSIFVELAKKFYDTSASNQTEFILSELEQPFVDWNGTLIQLFGGLVSGHNATAHFNSFMNSILLRMVFKHYYPNKKFRDYVSAITYGDDFLAGVSRECPLFNFKNIQKYVDEELDMKLTSYDKKATADEYANIFQVDFLKRRSVKIDDYYVGCLAKDSIYKSLYFTKAKKSAERTVLVSTITSAMHEIFFHGKHEYDKFRNHMISALEPLEIIMPILDVPYEDRLINWRAQHIPGYDIDYDNAPKTLVMSRKALGIIDEHGELIITDESFDYDDYVLHSVVSYNNNTTNFCDFMKSHGAPGDGIQALVPDLEGFSINSGIEHKTEQDNVSNALMDFQIREGAFSTGLTFHTDETFELAKAQADQIQDFLKRPVLVYEQDWESLSPLTGSINILQQFLSNARVSNRVNNYNYIRGTMCIRILCNGSPYHYGKAVAGINYWPEFDTARTGAGLQLTTNQIYQLPHIDINPTMGVAGCMSVPLYHPWNAVNLTVTEKVFTLELATINALRVASPTSTDTTPIKVKIWAWMSEYELLSPTDIDCFALTPQSATEYVKPAYSTGATITADAVGNLSNLPVIGPYARITEMAMRTTAALAAAMGYSRPHTINHEPMVTHRPLTNLSNANMVDSCTKLSLDVKQEVTIDSTVTGYQEQDDMLLINVAKREGILLSTTWDTTTNFLPRVIVSPLACQNSTVDYVALDPTPMSYVTIPFTYWRGNIKMRFEVVGSAFHRGKIRIVYDPLQPTSTIINDFSNTNYSYVMDIANEREYVMDIGWASNRPYLAIGDPSYTFTGTSDTPLTDFNGAFHNGTVSLYVEQPLRSVSGDLTPFVYINVYISAGDDFSLAQPSDEWMQLYSNNTPYVIQSIVETPGTGMAPLDNMMTDYELNKNNPASYSVNDKLSLILFGERIVSIRQLIKRYCSNYTDNMAGSDTINFYVENFNDFPLYGGPTSTGIDNTSTQGRLNWATYANYLNWYTPMFLMRRGGIRNKYLLAGKGNNVQGVITMAASRSNNTGYQVDIAQLSDPLNYKWFLNIAANNSTLNGSQVSITDLNPTVEIECPYYSNKRFFFAQDRVKEVNFAYDNIRRECGHKVMFIFPDSQQDLVLKRYTAAADDYSLYIFKYAPTLLQFRMDPPVQ